MSSIIKDLINFIIKNIFLTCLFLLKTPSLLDELESFIVAVYKKYNTQRIWKIKNKFFTLYKYIYIIFLIITIRDNLIVF